MPYDPGLAQRLADLLRPPGLSAEEDVRRHWLDAVRNMCVGVYKEWLIARVGNEAAAQILRNAHVKPMDITGKPMKGWTMIAPEGLEDDRDLARYIDLATAFVMALPRKD